MSKFNTYLEAVRKQRVEKPEKPVKAAKTTGGKFVLPPKADPSNYQITSSIRDFSRGETSKWKTKTLVGNNGSSEDEEIDINLIIPKPAKKSKWGSLLVKKVGEKYEIVDGSDIYWKHKKNKDSKIECEVQTIGNFKTVGYIAINLKNNQIIPISRNDEHQGGYEILQDYYKSKGIIESVNDWMNVSTSNFIYHSEDIKRWLVAAKKWIEYGGDPATDLVSTGYSGMKKFTTTFEEYIAHNGNPPTSHAKTGTLKPKGKEFVSIIERLARSIAAYHKGHPDIKAFDYALDLVDWDKSLGLKSPMFNLIYPLKRDNWDAFKKYEDGFKEKVMAAMAKEDYSTLEKLAFGFDGWKNLVHTGLKHWQKIQDGGKADSMDQDTIQKIESVFGDIEEAIKELDRVGGI